MDRTAARSEMTEPAPADTPVSIDRVEYTRDADGGHLRLSGRWHAAPEAGLTEPLLVVQVEGRRHRFAPAHEERETSGPGSEGWHATFHLPVWAQPRHEGQAALWVGTAVVPVPLPGAGPDGHRLPPPPALGEARAWPPEVAPPPPGADPGRLEGTVDPAVDTGRTGPLAELLFKESVSALHAELEQRSADSARLQGSLADAQSELQARAATQAALEAAHAELRAELQELMSAVGAQREDHERRLAAAEAERDQVRAELEAERDQVRAELEAERDQLRAELEAAREESQRAVEAERGRLHAELEAQRQDGERALEAERARTGAQLTELAAARDAAAAEAADLRHRLAGAASAQQHHAAELAALRDQLAAAQVSRDASAGEVAGLRAELERLGSELAVTREHQSAQGADLGEAQRLLAQARSLSEQLRSQSSQ